MKRRRTAFTLVELLVVVTVLAILMSMLLPVLRNAREQSRRTACASNVYQITLGSHSYALDNRGMLPPARGESELSDLGANRRLVYNGFYHADWDRPELDDHNWMSLETSGHIQDWMVYFCPSNQWSTLRPIGSIPLREWTWKVNHAPYHYYGGPNSWLSLNGVFPSDVPFETDIFEHIFRVSIARAGMVPLVTDMITEPGQHHEPNYENFSHNRRDPQGGNVAYVDGHVTWRAYNQMYIVKDPISGGVPWYRF